MIKKATYAGIILIVGIVGYNLISQITQALKSTERLSDATEVVYNLQERNKELKSKLTEIQTPEFVEKIARDKLGLSKKGETIVIIPDQTIKMVLGASNSAQVVRLPNPLGWLRLFWR